MKTTLEKEGKNYGLDHIPTLLEIAKKGSIIPFIVENSNTHEVKSIIICNSISGGALYVENMPTYLSLIRITSDMHKYTRNYVQLNNEYKETVKGFKTVMIDRIKKLISQNVEHKDQAPWNAFAVNIKKLNLLIVDRFDSTAFCTIEYVGSDGCVKFNHQIEDMTSLGLEEIAIIGDYLKELYYEH